MSEERRIITTGAPSLYAAAQELLKDGEVDFSTPRRWGTIMPDGSIKWLGEKRERRTEEHKLRVQRMLRALNRYLEEGDLFFIDLFYDEEHDSISIRSGSGMRGIPLKYESIRSGAKAIIKALARNIDEL